MTIALNNAITVTACVSFKMRTCELSATGAGKLGDTDEAACVVDQTHAQGHAGDCHHALIKCIPSQCSSMRKHQFCEK